MKHRSSKALVPLVVALLLALGALAVPLPAQAAETESSAQAVEFLYLDSGELAAGSTQNIVISLSDDAQPVSGTLVVRNQTTGAETTLASTKASGTALLFSFVPADEGTYEVESGEFALGEGSALSVSFADADASARQFTVGGAAVSTSVITTDADGNAVESPSVSAALAANAAGGIETQADVGSDGILTIAIDPGHGGSDGGAEGNDAQEAQLCWKIANYAADELRTYNYVNVVFTRSSVDEPLAGSTADDLQARVDKAVDAGADVLVSFHLNSFESAAAHGAEVWVPNNSSYNYYTHTLGEELGNSILAKLEALGLSNRGLKEGTYLTYPDGSAGDTLAINRLARKAGLTGILIENAFITSPSDYSQHLSNDDQLRQVGIADATGIAEAYHLTKASTDGLYRDVYRTDWFWSAVNYATEHGIMSGYGNGYFGPNSNLAREQAAAVMYNYLAKGATAARCSQTDVLAGQWYTTAVDWAVANGVMNGYGGQSTFGVGDPLTREQIAVVVANAVHANVAAESTVALDAMPDASSVDGWARQSVAWALNHGIISGVERNGTRYVDPQSAVTRAQVAAIMANLAQADLSQTSSGVATSSQTTSTQAAATQATSAQTTGGTPIMGTSAKSADAMVAYYNSLGVSYPSALAGKGAADISQFVSLLEQAAQAEGVRADVMFAQAMLETGNLGYGGQVSADSCNFCGLKTADGQGFATFADVYTGLLAQAQHLKAYASTDALNTALVDPRFGLVTRGSATTVEALQGKWTPDGGYVTSVLRILSRI